MNWTTDTDSITVEIVAPSFKRCGRHLRLSEIYLSIIHVLDLSPLLEYPENQIWKEFKERLSFEAYDALVQRTKEQKGVAGLYKLEHPFSSKMQVQVQVQVQVHFL